MKKRNHTTHVHAETCDIMPLCLIAGFNVLFIALFAMAV